MIGVTSLSLPAPDQAAAMIWTLLSIFVIAPFGALAFDKNLFGNWIWHIAPEKVRDYG
jgi:hypothetical protein